MKELRRVTGVGQPFTTTDVETDGKVECWVMKTTEGPLVLEFTHEVFAEIERMSGSGYVASVGLRPEVVGGDEVCDVMVTYRGRRVWGPVPLLDVPINSRDDLITPGDKAEEALLAAGWVLDGPEEGPRIATWQVNDNCLTTSVRPTEGEDR